MRKDIDIQQLADLLVGETITEVIIDDDPSQDFTMRLSGGRKIILSCNGDDMSYIRIQTQD